MNGMNEEEDVDMMKEQFNRKLGFTDEKKIDEHDADKFSVNIGNNMAHGNHNKSEHSFNLNISNEKEKNLNDKYLGINFEDPFVLNNINKLMEMGKRLSNYYTKDTSEKKDNVFNNIQKNGSPKNGSPKNKEVDDCQIMENGLSLLSSLAGDSDLSKDAADFYEQFSEFNERVINKHKKCKLKSPERLESIVKEKADKYLKEKQKTEDFKREIIGKIANETQRTKKVTFSTIISKSGETNGIMQKSSNKFEEKLSSFLDLVEKVKNHKINDENKEPEEEKFDKCDEENMKSSEVINVNGEHKVEIKSEIQQSSISKTESKILINNAIKPTNDPLTTNESFNSNSLIKKKLPNNNSEKSLDTIPEELPAKAVKKVLSSLCNKTTGKSQTVALKKEPMEDYKVKKQFELGEKIVNKLLKETKIISNSIERGEKFDIQSVISTTSISDSKNIIETDELSSDYSVEDTEYKKKMSCPIVKPITKRFQRKNLTFTDAQYRQIETDNKHLESRLKKVKKKTSGLSYNEKANYCVQASSSINRKKDQTKTWSENLKLGKKLRDIKERSNSKAPWAVPVWI